MDFIIKTALVGAIVFCWTLCRASHHGKVKGRCCFLLKRGKTLPALA